ncbi:MAG TPA: acyloxyacyl hydrolase [Pyrinomonadaceae bacterium]|jgi:hypothetical protein
MRKFFAAFACLSSLFIIIAVCPSAIFTQDLTSLQKKAVTAETGVVSTPQTSGTSDFDEKNELSVWGGFAPDMPRVFGGARPSSYGQLAVRYSRRIATSDSLALKYTIDFIPLAVINYDRRPIIQTAPNTFTVQSNNTTNYAFGLTPVGLQLHFRRKAKIQPFISANAGLLIFNKTIPDDRSAVFPNLNGKHLNFTLAGGGGVDFLTDAGRTFTVGFKFHHISNASTGNINPGFDQNLFYVGYTFKKW